MTNKKSLPREKTLQNADYESVLEGFTGDEDLYLEYAESLTAGDIRPIVIKDYVEEKNELL